MSSPVAAPARGRSAFALILAGLLWGTGGLSGSLLAAKAGLHALPVAAYRLLLGGSCTVLLLLLTGRRPQWTAAVVRRLLVAGALLAQFQACYFAAVTLTSVSIATMVTIGSVPLFVALATAVVRRRLPAPATLVSMAAAVAGLVLLTWSPEGVGSGARLLAGVAIALVAGAGFAVVTLVIRRPVEGLDSFGTTAFGLLIGGILLLPLGLASGMALPLRPDVLAVALYLGVVPTGVAYGAYFLALRTAAPVVAALSALLEPLTAAVLSAFLLHEQLGVAGWTGAALLVTALAVSYLRN
ncbi:DME family drug/metabolite transporter [Amycolatopsis bartoniae]|uniref:Membrane protein n=1 Tax=Amycolatopsis bartoniae TaxID=941986 RepID=A0A8H9IYX7_9PSEU|nr:DMT family transporter [Amycolatopsis bartoniae]MBB2933982.1 DME family drug/metabolite transporter [Amycolatopsis bartoniae]TVT02794.1 DMT family transporter [Amycolatopsis bartoniae]GHF86147.1 membrane protein [Amycolatopsis bartoniae]